MKNALIRWTARKAGLALTLMSLLPAAFATSIPAGTYRLGSIPSGAAAPPVYGLRLDELVNVSAQHDIFTFDFDNPGSAMFLDWNGTDTVHIYGHTYGGVEYDGDTAWKNSGLFLNYLGIYTIDFVYNQRVGPVLGDVDGVQDIQANAYANVDTRNSGYVILPDGTRKNLVEEKGDYTYTFRFGDQGALGYPGWTGLSGWGWMSVIGPRGEIVHTDAQDWLFTATPYRGNEIPEPGMMSMMGAGLLAMGLYRRLRK